MYNWVFALVPLLTLLGSLVLYRVWQILSIKIDQERIKLEALKEEYIKSGRIRG